MIYVATQPQEEGKVKAFFAKNKKILKEMGFQQIANFDTETRAVIWVNENYFHNVKEYLYG